MKWAIKIISKTLMIKISYISWGGYDKGGYDKGFYGIMLKNLLKRHFLLIEYKVMTFEYTFKYSKFNEI